MDGLYNQIYAANLRIIIVIIPVLVLVWSLLGAWILRRYRYIDIIAAFFSVAVILHLTVLSRSTGYKGCDLIPFSSFVRAIKQPEMYRSMLMNVFFFVPLGLALPYIYKGKTGKRIWLTILSGLILSVVIEIVQYIYSLGLAETDDVICNALGTAIGSSSYLLSLLWIRVSKRKVKSDE